VHPHTHDLLRDRGAIVPDDNAPPRAPDSPAQITDRADGSSRAVNDRSIDLENIAVAHPAVAIASPPSTRSGTSGRCWWW
jgi:hypothetical protein